jgi:hypothetical protein
VTALLGHYYDGKSARALPVEVRRDEGALVITGRDLLLSYPINAVRADPPLGHTRRVIRLPDGGQVQSDDHAALDALFPRRYGLETWVDALERRWIYVLAGLVITTAVVWYAVVHALPIVAERAARHIPIRIEKAIGEQTLMALDRTLFAPSTLQPPQQEALRRRFTNFTRGLNDGYDYRLEFRGGSIGANALALPGGTIVITDAMVKLTQNDEQRLAVLAHEIGHVKARHSLRMALQSAGVAALISTLTGDAVSITTLAVAVPTVLVQSSYSRAFETEADTFAFHHMKAHGLSPKYFAEVMRLTQKQNGAQAGGESGFNYFSSHPATEERVRRALAAQ